MNHNLLRITVSSAENMQSHTHGHNIENPTNLSTTRPPSTQHPPQESLENNSIHFQTIPSNHTYCLLHSILTYSDPPIIEPTHSTIQNQINIVNN